MVDAYGRQLFTGGGWVGVATTLELVEEGGGGGEDKAEEEEEEEDKVTKRQSDKETKIWAENQSAAVCGVYMNVNPGLWEYGQQPDRPDRRVRTRRRRRSSGG